MGSKREIYGKYKNVYLFVGTEFERATSATIQIGLQKTGLCLYAIHAEYVFFSLPVIHRGICLSLPSALLLAEDISSAHGVR